MNRHGVRCGASVPGESGYTSLLEQFLRASTYLATQILSKPVLLVVVCVCVCGC
jgi:hypothetical protein